MSGPKVQEAVAMAGAAEARAPVRLVLDENLVLAAGAGSGKTHALVTVALGLYAGAGGRPPIDPGRVWAVTFTEKAAAELRQRIADRALALAASGGSLEREPDLAELLGGRRPTAAAWERIAAALPQAPIGTFHSLCGQILRSFAAEAQLDPRFAVLDEAQSSSLFERAREEVLLEGLTEEGPARRLARELGGVDPLRSAIDALHARLAEEGRDPRSLLEGEPFDRQRARSRFGDACGMLALGLHELGASDHPRLQAAVETLARERPRIGRCEPEAIDRWYPAVAAVLARSPGRGRSPEPWPFVKRCWEGLQIAWAALRQAEIGEDLVQILEAVDRAYAAEKRRAGGLDFADLVRRARDLLRDDRAVRREAKRRIGALLVDEFQDTNGVQLELVHLLAEARDEERELPPRELPLEPAVFCAVGDRKQSIYEFRGADVSLFAELTARAREGQGFRLQALTRSWRSRPGLVRFANGLFAEVLAPASRPYEIGWVEAEDALAPQRPEIDDRPAVQLLESDPELKAEDRRPFEARLVAAHVEGLLASGRTVVEKNGVVRPLRGADVAILLGRFTHLPLYQQALAERGIPSIVVNGRGFFGAREIRDLGALLLACCDPFDRFASAAVLRSPLGGLSDDALVRLAAARQLELGRHAKGCAADPPVLHGAERERLDRLGRLVARLSREVDRLGPAGVLRHAIDALSYLPVLAATPGGEQRIANVEKLLRRLEERRGLGALRAAEEILAAADDPEDREPPADVAAFADARAVRFLTVHASKGLEFPVVVLPELGAEDPKIRDAVLFDRRLGLAIKPTDPLHRRIADEHAQAVYDELKARQEAEKRRLFYVAVTRARDLLVLCGARGRNGGTTWRAMLDEALPHLEPLVERVPLPAGGVGARAGDGGDRTAAQAETAPADASAGAPLAARAAALRQQVEPIRPAPGRFVAAVTELAELLRCERRYFYKVVAGLEEHPGGPLDEILEVDEADLPGIDRLARGQLAHRLLECVDLDRALHDPAAAVAAEILAEGLDPALPEVAAIAEDVVAFLRSPLGRSLAAAPASRRYRELPFALELQGPEGARLALRGQIDLLFFGDDGVLHLVDYKHASGRGQAPEAYRFQLQTYALAAARLLPGDLPIRAGIVWLRDRGAPPAAVPIDRQGLDEHERRLAALGDTLARARARGRWEKLPSPASCAGCGFAVRCWGGRVR